MSTILDLDAMMDSTLDNVADVPDYQNPPNGLYNLAVTKAEIDSYKNKEGVEVPRLKIGYKVVSTIETTEVPVVDGTMFNETFQATEDGLGYFKKQAKAILNVTDLNGVPMRDILSSLEGVEFKAVVKTRTSVNNGKTYENVNVRPKHDA